MGRSETRKEPNCKRRPDLSHVEEQTDKVAKKQCMNTAVEITTQVGTKQPKVNKPNAAKKAAKATGKTRSICYNKDNETMVSDVDQETEAIARNNNASITITKPVCESNLKVSKRSSKVKEIAADKAVPGCSTQETAYEQIYRKAKENRAKRGEVMLNSEETSGEQPINKAEPVFNKSYDGILVDINASDDDFGEESEEETIPEQNIPLVNSNILSQVDQMGNATSGRPASDRPVQDVGQPQPQPTNSKFAKWRQDPEFKLFMAEVMSEMNEASAQKARRSDEARPRGKVVNDQPREILVNKLPSDTTIYQPAFKKINKIPMMLLLKSPTL